MNIDEPREFYFRQLETRVGIITGELTRVRFGSMQARAAWPVSMNAYRCRDCILVVAELAGIDRAQISLSVEPRRVRLRGHREPPEPRKGDGPPLQVLAMEIDHGAFEREIVLPVEVEPERVEAEQREGLLWIRLPLAEPA